MIRLTRLDLVRFDSFPSRRDLGKLLPASKTLQNTPKQKNTTVSFTYRNSTNSR